jgi:hypothetical protein
MLSRPAAACWSHRPGSVRRRSSASPMARWSGGWVGGCGVGRGGEGVLVFTCWGVGVSLQSRAARRRREGRWRAGENAAMQGRSKCRAPRTHRSGPRVCRCAACGLCPPGRRGWWPRWARRARRPRSASAQTAPTGGRRGWARRGRGAWLGAGGGGCRQRRRQRAPTLPPYAHTHVRVAKTGPTSPHRHHPKRVAAAPAARRSQRRRACGGAAGKCR